MPSRSHSPDDARRPDHGAAVGPAPRLFAPGRIAAVYLALGILWILLTDFFLAKSGGMSERGFFVAAGKGSIFVVASSLIVWLLTRREYRNTTHAHALLRAVVQGTSDAVFVKDRQGRYLLFNEAAARFVGKPAERVVGLDDHSLFSPEDARLVIERDRAVMESGLTETREDELTAGGATRVFLATKAPYRDETGHVIGLIGISVDITDRRHADSALRQSEERYRRLVEVLPAAVFIHDGEKMSFCNPAFVRLIGADSAQELIGTSPFSIAHPDDHPRVRARIDHMRTSGEPSPRIEMRIVRRDGRPVAVQSAATPVIGSQPPSFLVALSDLSERERSTATLRAVMGSVGDAIVTIDARGRIESANPSTERLFGYPEAELLGCNVSVLMPEPHRTEHDDYVARYLRTGEAKIIGRGREVDGRRRDGTTFPVELTVTRFELDGELRFTGVLRDITARRRLEEQFRQAQKMEAVGRLAGGVAHDFNNLLTIINGHADLLLEGLPENDAHRESAAAVRDAGDRAARLTRQLLAFSRRAVVAPRLVDLGALVADSARLLRRLIGENIALSVRAGSTPVWIVADPGQIEQVVMNLALNARDAMPRGGTLTIETGLVGPESLAGHPALPAGRYARLRVADTGEGMTDEVKSRIFEPFFTTKEVGRGSGLGLAVVHGVVSQAGGTIVVESAPGAGTRFEILLPSADAATIPAPADAAASAPRGTETILLVEDEEAVRRIARISLEMHGYQVLSAATGPEAARIAAEHSGPIGLLVTDVVMPALGGRDLAELIRARRPGLPVLFISGYADDATLEAGLKSGESFLQKPFSPGDLARRARELLDRTD